VSEPATIERPLAAPGAPPTQPVGAAFATLWHSPIIQVLALITLAAAIFFFHLGRYGLWEPDEARYAEIAREMLAGRGFIVPHLNYVAYVEKPPLLYWLGAMWMTLLGVNEFAARLTSALAALVGVLATWVFARRAIDGARAFLAGAILATSTLYAVMAQVLTTDMLLSATITVALFALFLHWREGGRWCWLGYAAIALGILTKGPVAAVIPALALGFFLWWEGELRGAFGRFHALWGGALVLAVAAPWFVVMALREPGFFDFYFVGEHLRRFFQSSYSHREPLYYYVPVLLAGMMPWTLFAPFIAWRGLARTSAGRFCIVAAAVVLALFSAASAKLIPYILPAMAPIAVLLADGILTRAFAGIASASSGDSPISTGNARAGAAADGKYDGAADRIYALAGQSGAAPPSAPPFFIAVGVMLTALGAGAIAAAVLARLFKSPYLLATRPALYALGIIGVAGGALVGELFRHVRAEAGLAALVLAAALGLGAGSYARLEAEPLRSYAALAREVAARAPGATLICYPRYVQALPFYTHRRAILVGAQTELAFGAAHAADADRYFFHSEADVLRLWNMPGPVVLVLDERELRQLRGRLGDYVVIGAEWHKRAILKVAEPRYAS
jgi:4-amino-4-deoxy-L-arabinose transferase-like glycosyltransferase